MSNSGEEQVTRSNCRGCHGGCGVLVHVRDGRVVKIEGDPDFPTNRGTMCSKGLAYHQLVYHPDRLIHPLRRSGKKGEGTWQRISWEEALDTIANRYEEIKAECGAEAIVMACGTGRDNEGFLMRFAHLLGTPNVITAGHMCYVTRLAASLFTCGNLPVCDYEGRPECGAVRTGVP